MFGALQAGVVFVLAIGAFAFEAWALIDALRHAPGAYVAASKQTKAFWVVILAGATVVGFLGLPYPLGLSFTSVISFLGIAAIAGAGVYAASVRPALRSVGPGPRRSRDQRGGW
jgi:hypothetical protein